MELAVIRIDGLDIKLVDNKEYSKGYNIKPL